jgi:hypothetical protein
MPSSGVKTPLKRRRKTGREAFYCWLLIFQKRFSLGFVHLIDHSIHLLRIQVCRSMQKPFVVKSVPLKNRVWKRLIFLRVLVFCHSRTFGCRVFFKPYISVEFVWYGLIYKLFFFCMINGSVRRKESELCRAHLEADCIWRDIPRLNLNGSVGHHAGCTIGLPHRGFLLWLPWHSLLVTWACVLELGTRSAVGHYGCSLFKLMSLASRTTVLILSLHARCDLITMI